MRIDAQYGTVRFVFNASINTQQFAVGHDEEKHSLHSFASNPVHSIRLHHQYENYYYFNMKSVCLAHQSEDFPVKRHNATAS